MNFPKRSIELPFVYLIVDAVYVKIRYYSLYVNTVVLIISGIPEDGYREILGFAVPRMRMKDFGYHFLKSLSPGDYMASNCSEISARRDAARFFSDMRFIFLRSKAERTDFALQ
jgi:hypothetical protein